MQARGDRRVQEALLKALRGGPKDVLEIRNAIRAEVGTLIAGREGHLHALLHDRLRRGGIRVVGASKSGLARYAKPDPGKPGEGTADVPAPSDLGEAKAATRIAAAARDASSRSRITADVVAHRRALEGKSALEGFGSVRGAKHMLRRVDRGKRTVLFADGPADMGKKVLLHEGPWILATVIAFLVIRAFLAEVFVIPSTSMVPTLLEGDRVVVFKPGGQAEPERWSILTFKRQDVTYVKRAAGVGGETIALVGGDVYIDGALAAKPPELAEALRAPYATWSTDAIRGWAKSSSEGGETAFAYEGTPLWSSAAPATQPRAARDVRLRDAYAALDATRPAGAGLGLDLVYRMGGEETPVAVYRIEVTDDGVRHLVQVGGETRFIQRQPGGEANGPLTLGLSYVDGVLEATVGSVRWARTVEPADRPPVGAWLQPRIRVWGSGAELLALRLDRDHHYTEVGQLGVPPSSATGANLTYGYRIPDGTVFFLGDNTSNSNDSRFSNVGTIPYDDLIGPVRFRIWPPLRLGFPK